MLSVLRQTNSCLHRTVVRNRTNNLQIIRNLGKNGFEKRSQNLNQTSILENFKTLIKPLIFTFGFSGTVYSLYIVYNFETSIRLRQKFNPWNQWKQNSLIIEGYNNKTKTLTKRVKEWWNTSDNCFKLFLGIASINVLVFVCWKVPRLQPFMLKHFMTNTNIQPLKCFPMILSNFSHYSATHLVLNLFVLHSFIGIGEQLFGWDQLLALYLTSGVVSSFGSYLAKVMTGRVSTSLGASGAILGILSSCCLARPDLQLMIVFLPFFTISAGMALKAIILMDSAGLVLGWRLFDHGAHLGGTLFGIWYTTYGQNIVLENKHKVINIWQKIRNKRI